MHAYIPFRLGQEVGWSCIVLDHLLFLVRWHTGEMTGLVDKHVHERRWEVNGQFAYHECRLLYVGVRFKADVWLSSLDENVTAAHEPLGDYLPYPPFSWLHCCVGSDGYWQQSQRLELWRYALGYIFWPSTISCGSVGLPALILDWMYCASQSATCVTTLH